MMKPDAISAVAHAIEREWGYGYSVRQLTEGPVMGGSAIGEVWASDGSVFYVGADRWGNVRHGDTRPEVASALLDTLAGAR